MPRPTSETTVTFGEFTFDVATLELRRLNEVVRLQPQPAQVLAELLARQGELVTRDALRQILWGDETFVDFDRGLNYCINQIRSALGETADEPGRLETLRGRGYRFNAAPDNAVPDRETPAARPAAGRRRWLPAAAGLAAAILVGWFGAVSLSSPARTIGIGSFGPPGAPNDEPGGLRSEIIARLARSSAFPVVDLGSTSGGDDRIAWRVEGRVDRDDGRTRVTVQLTNNRNGSVQWSEVFEPQSDNWLDARAEVAEMIAFAIRATLEGPAAAPPGERLRRRAQPSTAPSSSP